MPQTFFLIDLENVSGFKAATTKTPGHLILVAGQQLVKRASKIVSEAKQLNLSAECYLVPQTGKNAADFALACLLGELATTHADAEFVIISNDRGFDAVVAFYTARGRSCRRVGYTSSKDHQLTSNEAHNVPDSTKSTKVAHGVRNSVPNGCGQMSQTSFGRQTTSDSPTFSQEDCTRLDAVALPRVVAHLKRQIQQGQGLPKKKKKLIAYVTHSILGPPITTNTAVAQRLVEQLINKKFIYENNKTQLIKYVLDSNAV